MRAERTKLATVWKAALVLAFGLLAVVRAEGTPPGEYDVKAAFLYNFLFFTEWPPTAFDSPSSPFVIGVLGQDPFGPALDAMLKGERIKERPVIVWRVGRLEGLSHCHILFISASESKQLGSILRQLKTRPVLTVSDMAAFAEAGGAISFTTDNSVRLTINPAAVQTAHLALSAKLLRLAQLVPQSATATAP